MPHNIPDQVPALKPAMPRLSSQAVLYLLCAAAVAAGCDRHSGRERVARGPEPASRSEAAIRVPPSVRLTDLGELPGTPLELGGIGVGPSFLAISVCSRSIDPATDNPTASTHKLAGKLVLLDRPETGRPIGTARAAIPLGGQIGGLDWDGDCLLAVVYDKARIFKIRGDASGDIVASIPTPSHGVWGGLAFDGHHIWLHGTDDDRRTHTSRAEHKICKLEASTGKVLLTLPSDSTVQDLAFVDGFLLASVIRPHPSGTRSAIRVLDPAGSQRYFDYDLPTGYLPNGMKRIGGASLVIAMQVGADPHVPMRLIRADLAPFPPPTWAPDLQGALNRPAGFFLEPPPLESVAHATRCLFDLCLARVACGTISRVGLARYVLCNGVRAGNGRRKGLAPESPGGGAGAISWAPSAPLR